MIFHWNAHHIFNSTKESTTPYNVHYVQRLHSTSAKLRDALTHTNGDLQVKKYLERDLLMQKLGFCA